MIEFRVRSLAATISTNDEVKQAAEAGEPEGLAVRAAQQTGGYGRQGRTWASPIGGLYQSLLLRPNVPTAELPTLSPIISLAVRRALASLVSGDNSDRILIKWPNDMVVPGDCQPFDTGEAAAPYRKLCGISLEVHAGGVCVGTGVNVRKPETNAPIGGKNTPAYLPELGFNGSIDQVGDAILKEFAPLYAQWHTSGFAPLLAEYNAHAYLTGHRVRVANQSEALVAEGTVEGVNAEGCLVVRTGEGALIPVSSGEAHLV